MDPRWRRWLRPTSLIRLAVALGAGLGLWLAIDAWIAGQTRLVVDAGTGPVELLDPGWLRLIAVVPVFYLVRVISLTDLSVKQQVVQATLRSLVVAGLALALARPTRVTRDARVATVVLVDVSESISDGQLAAARRYIDELDRARGDDGSLQVVAFAEAPAVVRRVDGAFDIRRHLGAGAGTDVQAAMQLGYGLYPDGHLPRMIVITDGNQTEGDIAVESYRARELGVRVSWRTFDHDKVSEVRVVGLSLPDEVKVGQPFDVTAELWSTDAQKVTVTLRQDEFPNPLDPTRTVDLHEGKNLIKLKSEAKRAGATTYTLELARAEKDTESKNNRTVMTTPVKGRPSVLYVEGGVLRDPGQAGYLQRGLEHEDIDVEVRGPRGIPADPKQLEKFDLVVVSDVPAHLLGAGQMQALDTYVAGYGGGLILAGGQDAFGSGGYQGSRIERISPVRFDGEKVNDRPNVALILVIDKSGSMQGEGIENAKISARATAEALDPRDILGVVAFDDAARTYVQPQPASNRMRISAEISRLQGDGGTNIYPGLAEAFELMQGLTAKIKHVIVISDGEAPYDGIVELVQDMRAAAITVSCVGVPGADKTLLEIIADNGDGRVVMADELGKLPKIIVDETKVILKSQLVEDVVYVRVAKQVEAIEGTGVENAPPLHGYVTTKPKPTAETILISDLGEPILARWRHGAGTVVAWTSDVKNRWGAEWVRWGGYPKFWAQLVRTTMRRKVYDSYDLSATVADGRAEVVVDAIDPNDRFVNELDTVLEVIDPATGVVTAEVAMDQRAAGRYTAGFQVQRYGSFLLKAVHKRDGKTVAESVGSVALPYPVEYLRSTPDPEPLIHAATVTGGHDQAEPAEVWDPRDETIAYTQDLWPWVLLVVAGLYLLDIYSRRVRLFGYRTIKFS